MKIVKLPIEGGKEIEHAAANAHEFAQVLEHSGEAVIVKDLNAVVTYWNRGASSIYGFSAQEAVGQRLRKLHAADLSDADYARILVRVRAGVPTSATTQRRKKSGEILRVAIRTTPLLDSGGTLIGEITVARDVTALLHSQEALGAAQATLQVRLAGIRDANRNLTREIAGRHEADAEMRRNIKALAATVRQLESFHRDGEALSRIAALLQSCTQRVEAYAIVRETGAQLFPHSEGSLFIYRESRDVLEHAAAWGAAQPPALTLAPDECWALRLGSPHFGATQGHHPLPACARGRRELRLHAGAGVGPRSVAFCGGYRPPQPEPGARRRTTPTRDDGQGRAGAGKPQIARRAARDGAAGWPDGPVQPTLPGRRTQPRAASRGAQRQAGVGDRHRPLQTLQ
jgi:PAS domain S-box-containing protein